MRVYDEVLVPRMFEPWAKVLLDELEIVPDQALLDIACGPGSVARLAAERLGAGGRVTACDLSPGMLALARAKPPVENGAPIAYLEAPADSVPVADEDFDVVTCQQGLQFFPDRGAVVAEMHRALRLGGRVGIAVWTEIGNSPVFAALGDAIEPVVGQELADAYRGGPWGFADGEAIGLLLEQAGFTHIRRSAHVVASRFEGGAPQILATLSASGIAGQIAELSVQARQQLVDALTRAVGRGEIDSEMESNLVTARR